MFAVKPLPLTVSSRANECITSLASRLAYRNGAPRLVTFCSDVGSKYLWLANGDNAEIRRMAALAGHDPDLLLQNTPRLIRKDWFLLGKAEIKSSAFQRTKPSVCPECVRELGATARDNAAHQTGLSQLISVRTCMKHRCLLQDLPKPASNKDHFDAAQLGQGFVPSSTRMVAETDLKLERFIRRRLKGEQDGSWFDNLPFHVGTQTAENFGLLMLKGPNVKRQAVTPADWVKAGNIGYGFLKHGIDALIDKLCELERNRPDDNLLYRGRFGVFFEWLRNRDDDPAFDEIRDPVRKFIFETYPVPRGAQVLGVENSKRRFHSHRTLAKERRLNPTKTRHALLQRGYMRRHPDGKFELLQYVPADVADDVAHELNRVFSVSRTAKKIGISRPALDDLTKQGLIRLHFKHRGAVPGYHSDEIWRFARAITANWQPYFRNDTAKSWVSFQDAAKRSKCSIWQVIRIVIDRGLPVANPDRKKKLLHDYIVCPKAVESVFERAEKSGLTLVKAGNMLGCKTDQIERRIKNGDLIEIPEYMRRTRAKFRTVERDGVVALLSTGAS